MVARLVSRTVLMLCGLALVAMLWSAVVAAAEVNVRAGVHKGFARIVFDLPGKMDYSARIEGGALTVDFAQPVSPALAPIRRHLFRYVNAKEISSDGKALKLGLLKPVTLKEQWIDNSLVIDLVDAPADAAATAAKPAAEPVAKPPAAATVTVRAGDHAGYSRLVFDWRQSTDYRVETGEGKADVLFSEPAIFDLSRVTADRPDRLQGIAAMKPDRGSGVRLDFAKDARVRHFRSGRKVVVDILGAVPKADDKTVKTAPAGAVDTADTPPSGKSAPRSLLKADERSPAPPAKAETPESKPAAPSKVATPKTKPTPPAVVTKNLPAQPLKAVSRKVAKGQPRYSANSTKLEFAVDRSGDTVYLSFAWPEPVAAAAFERTGYLWLLFDSPAEVPVSRLSGDDGVLEAQQISDGRATILRMKIRSDRFASLRRKGAIWLLSLSERSAGAQTSVPAVSQPNADGGSRVFLPVSDTGNRLTVYDPEVGDELVVVPLLGDSVGVAVAQKFAQFELLASLQGLALRPIADDIQIEPLRNGVVVTAESGLLLSEPDSIQRSSGAQPYRSSLKKPITHFIAWQGGRDAGFQKRKRALQEILSKSPAAGRNVARWELAKFYIGHGLATEAMAVIRLIEKDDPGAAQDPQFRAVRGVANLLMERLEAAESDLMHAELKLYPDVALWRGDLLARQGDVEAARKEFALGAGVLPVLPVRMRERILRQWAVAAVEAGDDPSFRQAERELLDLPGNSRIRSTLAYLNGHVASRDGRDEEALAKFDEAIAADYRPFRTRASFERIDASLRQGEISPRDAIGKFDALRFAWRGDDFELEVMDRIVELELETKFYGNALNHLREAISYFPESDRTKAMASLMNSVFVDLFLNGKADELSPVSALALYYEFQELTPLGEDGDEMIQRLADRLASIDLLGKAAKLLDHQVTYRLQGQKKARIGARLAVIYLLDAKPDQALDALQRTNSPILSPALETERRYLQARALAEVGRAEDALALLGEDDSGAADLLRADIFWRDQRWADAAKTAQAVLGERWRGEAELTPREQTQIVQIAVSLYMSDDIPKLRELNDRYGEKMTDGSYSETFRLLTQRIDLSKTEFRKLAGEIARTAELEAFMTSYRDKVKSGGLSALN